MAATTSHGNTMTTSDAPIIAPFISAFFMETVMRAESAEIVKAFLERRPAKAARTHTDGVTLYLQGNAIAWHNPDDFISMTLAGWPTTTTRDRLNTLCAMAFNTKPFHQKKHMQYYNDMMIGPREIVRVKRLELLTPDQMRELLFAEDTE